MNITDGEIQRVELCIAGSDRDGCFVRTKDDWDKHGSDVLDITGNFGLQKGVSPSLASYNLVRLHSSPISPKPIVPTSNLTSDENGVRYTLQTRYSQTSGESRGWRPCF